MQFLRRPIKTLMALPFLLHRRRSYPVSGYLLLEIGGDLLLENNERISLEAA